AHTRHGEDITIKNESYLTAVEANEVKIGQQRCPTKSVFAFEVPHSKQTYGDSATTRERISFLLAFSEPERNTGVCQARLTARGTIKANACPFREEVLSESAIGVRLRVVGPVDGERLAPIGGMEREQQPVCMPGLFR